ncbi:MAG: cupin domain-containing protein [Candidatus Hydrothermales bacterium]
MEKIQIFKIFEEKEGFWVPYEIAVVEDVAVRVAMIHGEFPFHVHNEGDELFIVLKGEIYIDTEERTYNLREGEGLLVKKGTRHRSRANIPSLIMLIEPKRLVTKPKFD